MIRLFLLALIFQSTFIFSQYNLVEINYTTDGYTDLDTLKKSQKIVLPMSFKTMEELEQYLSETRQNIFNMRYYHDVAFEVGDVNGNDVSANLKLNEKISIIPLVLAVYSNDTLTIPMILIWSNVGGYLFNSALISTFSYDFDAKEVSGFGVTTAFSNIKLWDLNWSFNYSQRYSTTSKVVSENGKTIENLRYSNHQSSIGADFVVPLDLFKINPGINFVIKYNYDFKKDILNEKESVLDESSVINGVSVSPDLNLNFGFGKIDLEANGFKNGYYINLDTTNRFYLGDIKYSFDVSLYANYFFSLSFVEFTTGFYSFYSFNRVRNSMGFLIRGMKNDKAFGDIGASFNNFVNFEIFRIPRRFALLSGISTDVGFFHELKNAEFDKELFKVASSAIVDIVVESIQGLRFYFLVGIDWTALNSESARIWGGDKSAYDFSTVDAYSFSINLAFRL